MKKITILLLVIVILMIACTLSSCGEVQIDMKQFINVEFSGISDEGNADINLNYLDFESAYYKAKGNNDPYAYENTQKLYAFEATLNYTVTPFEGLKNGDEVTVNITYDENVAKIAGINPTNSSYTVKVEGLVEPIFLDAFDPSFFDTERGVMIRYNGIVPDGYLEISNKLEKSNPASQVSYSFDTNDIEYGETATITASLPVEAKAAGYILKDTYYEYTLTGVDHYMTNTDELNTDKTQLKNDLQDMITAITANDGSSLRGNGRWGITNELNYKFDSEFTSLSDIKFDKFICLKEKDGIFRKVYVSMQGTVNTTETTYPITGLFELEDFVIAGDGSLKYRRDHMHYSFYANDEEAYDINFAPQLMKYNIDKVEFE